MSNKRMSYNDVYEVIAMYANKILPLYADYWSRFPVGDNAYKISNELKNKAISYKNINLEIAAKIENAANEVSLHINE